MKASEKVSISTSNGTLLFIGDEDYPLSGRWAMGEMIMNFFKDRISSDLATSKRITSGVRPTAKVRRPADMVLLESIS